MDFKAFVKEILQPVLVLNSYSISEERKDFIRYVNFDETITLSISKYTYGANELYLQITNNGKHYDIVDLLLMFPDMTIKIYPQSDSEMSESLQGIKFFLTLDNCAILRGSAAFYAALQKVREKRSEYSGARREQDRLELRAALGYPKKTRR